MRPEQELVVKYEGWRLMALRSGTMCRSIVPFGDLSGSVEPIDASVAAFLFSNSILRLTLSEGSGLGFLTKKEKEKNVQNIGKNHKIVGKMLFFLKESQNFHSLQKYYKTENKGHEMRFEFVYLNRF